MNTIAYANINDHILTILVGHNCNYSGFFDIVDPLFCTYYTKKFKIIKIQSIKTNKIVDKVEKKFFNDFYILNNDYDNDNIIYFLSYKKAFYYYLGYIRATTHFEKNKPKYFEYDICDTYQEWYENGFLLCESYHINGNLEGPYKKYSLDGNLIVDAYFVNDKPIYYNHYKDGKIFYRNIE
jgi:hypothetical protein